VLVFVLVIGRCRSRGKKLEADDDRVYLCGLDGKHLSLVFESLTTEDEHEDDHDFIQRRAA